MDYKKEKAGYVLSTEREALNIDVIHDYLSTKSYWALHIPKSVVEKAIAHSLCFGLYLGSEQVGFGRLITDRATFGYLADVFILPEHRGQGLSKWMMGAILEHPDLQGLRKILLTTRDAHGLYTQFGFEQLDAPERVMQLHKPDVYQTLL